MVEDFLVVEVNRSCFGVCLTVFVTVVSEEEVTGIGFEGGRCKIKEEVSEFFMVSVETEVKSDELVSVVELDEILTGESKMET